MMEDLEVEDDQLPASKKPRFDEATYKHHLVLLKQEMKKKKGCQAAFG